MPVTAEKNILYILCLLHYFKSHLNCHSFSNLTFSQPNLPYTNLFKSYSDQTIVLHRIFQCFLISLRAKSRVLTMTCKTLYDLQPHLPPPLWLYLTLFFSSVSHQAPGTEVCLLFLQFTLHIMISGVWETVVSSAKNDLPSDISVNDSIDLYMFLFICSFIQKGFPRYPM